MIANLIIIAGGFLYLITATLHLAEKNKTFVHYLLITYFFSSSLWITYDGLLLMDIILKYPHLALVHMPFYFFSAPLLYFFFKILTSDTVQFRPLALVHLIPGLMSFLLLLPFYMKSADEKTSFLQSQKLLGSMSASYEIYPFLMLCAVISVTGYSAVFAGSLFAAFHKETYKFKRVTILSFIIIALNYSATIIYIITFILFRKFSLDISFFRILLKFLLIAMSLQVYLFLILKTRHPDYMKQIKEEAKRIHYSKSRIANIDVESITERLHILMEVEKIFCDEDLTLAKVADELSITTYQLSQILNERILKNFNSFINEYRIKEAEILLLDEPGRSVTSISYAVGFNTPATFYKSFAKIHSISPRQYRIKYQSTR